MVGQSANDSTEKLQLPTELNRQALKELVENKLTCKFEECETEISQASSKGDNYLGILYRIDVTRHGKKEFTVVVKLPPQNEARREQFFIVPVFQRESMFYDEFYPMIKKFQEQKGINVELEGFHEVPKCFKTITVERSEAIFMEDLKGRGFEMFDRFKEVTIDQVAMVMKVLGKFHAISFAIKDQQMDLIKPYSELVDIFVQREDDPNLTMWLETMKTRALAVIEDDPDTEFVQRAKDSLKEPCFVEMKKMVQAKSAEPYTVVTHGDCWNNNMMFKNQNGISKELCLLDWQLMRYSSPVLDLLYYIFGCTTKEFRDQHYQESLDIYYESLSSYIRRLGSDPEKCFPRSVFDQHLKEFGKFGLIMATMVLPIFTSNADDIPDMDEIAEKFNKNEEVNAAELNFNSDKTIDKYNKRMGDVFRDMYRLEYI